MVSPNSSIRTGRCRLGREQVKDAAPDGKGAPFLYQGGRAVAEPYQSRQQFIAIEFVTGNHAAGSIVKHCPWDNPLQQGRNRSNYRGLATL